MQSAYKRRKTIIFHFQLSTKKTLLLAIWFQLVKNKNKIILHYSLCICTMGPQRPLLRRGTLVDPKPVVCGVLMGHGRTQKKKGSTNILFYLLHTMKLKLLRKYLLKVEATSGLLTSHQCTDGSTPLKRYTNILSFFFYNQYSLYLTAYHENSAIEKL